MYSRIQYLAIDPRIVYYIPNVTSPTSYDGALVRSRLSKSETQNIETPNIEYRIQKYRIQKRRMYAIRSIFGGLYYTFGDRFKLLQVGIRYKSCSSFLLVFITYVLIYFIRLLCIRIYIRSLIRLFGRTQVVFVVKVIVIIILFFTYPTYSLFVNLFVD